VLDWIRRAAIEAHLSEFTVTTMDIPEISGQAQFVIEVTAEEFTFLILKYEYTKHEREDFYIIESDRSMEKEISILRELSPVE